MANKRVVISGASGLIGNALSQALSLRGYTVHPLVRRVPKAHSSEIRWSPQDMVIDVDALEGVDAVVHLAGESIASGRWSKLQKVRILQSRIQGTQLLSQALAGLDAPPSVLVSASGVGYYGDGGATLLREDAPAGEGFLAEVCVAWEKATEPASTAGIRAVIARTAMVLSREGGALRAMMPLFKLGGGGRLGSGEQFMSWITLDDHVRALVHLIETKSLEGPVNCVAPNPVTNAVFTAALGKALKRPSIMAVPAAVLRLTLGEMAEELLLKGQRASSAKLEASGFSFQHEELEAALEAALK
ncbi:MAG: TIGR01777 family protein [Bradymonadaceae bacterium]|nr:TIGR01777 family protein [Lujinxingiaceae bacterium]